MGIFEALVDIPLQLPIEGARTTIFKLKIRTQLAIHFSDMGPSFLRSTKDESVAVFQPRVMPVYILMLNSAL